MSNTIKKRSAGGVVYCYGKVLAIRVIPQDELVFPKGTIEPNETPEETAVREIFEETGYKARIKNSLGQVAYEFYENDGKHYKKTVYHFLLDLIDKDAEPTRQRGEGEEFENVWLEAEEAFKKLTHDNCKDILRKALAIAEAH